MSDSATPGTVAHQALPSMGFSRQEYWSGLPFPSPGDLPDPGLELVSSMLQAEDLPSEPPGMFSHTIKNSCLTNVFRICGQNFNSSCNGIIFIFLIYIYIFNTAPYILFEALQNDNVDYFKILFDSAKSYHLMTSV